MARTALVALLALLLAVSPAVFPQSVSSGELVENARDWDGQTVLFTGEAIGEAMRRGKMAWIHLNDDAYMGKNIEEGATLGGYNSGHAVWLAADLAGRITFYGDFKHEGDVVEVTGVFNAACAEHGGDMDIHATRLEVIRAGHPVAHNVNLPRAILAGILLAVTALAFAARRLVLRRRS